MRTYTRTLIIIFLTVIYTSLLGQSPVRVAPCNIIQDKGSFRYYINEELVSEGTFEWTEDGTFTSANKVMIAGQDLMLMTYVMVDRDGYWNSIAMETAMGSVNIDLDSDSVRIDMLDNIESMPITENMLILDDWSPAMLSQMLSAYNQDQTGRQTFTLFFIPHDILEVTLEKIDSTDIFLLGEPKTFLKYSCNIPGVYQILIWADHENRVYACEYPEQHGKFIRDGYDVLLSTDETDSLLSQPIYEVQVNSNVMIPMRDGIRLATDIYLPDAEGTFPNILVRTPYKKEMGEYTGKFYARRGYVCAIQDCRGRFSSEGQWEPFMNEVNDGYDAVEWLAVQPKSNGKVGMIGASYLGWTQLWAASQKPDHLVTIIPNVAPPEPFYNLPYEYGAFFLTGSLWWADVVVREATADISGLIISHITEILTSANLDFLPVIDLDKELMGYENKYWREWIEHSTQDEYWERTKYFEQLKDVDIPVFHQSGWFDADGIGTKLNYRYLAENKNAFQKLVIGPWGHTDTDTRMGAQGLDWGAQAVINLQKQYLRWMDYWLLGIDNGIDSEPLVSLFVMQSNKWLSGDKYPLEKTVFAKFYLVSNGSANGISGDGHLTVNPDDFLGAVNDTFTYDPGDPTPMIPSGRNDVLVYQTIPLETDLTIAGPVSAVLYAATSATDTDWVMRLFKLDANNSPFELAHGIIRARYHKSMSAPKLIDPDKIYKYDLDLWHTGITVKKGEKLAVVVSSAMFPQFSRNLNTGGHNEKDTAYITALQKIYHTQDYPSHILLPVIPKPEFGEYKAQSSK